MPDINTLPGSASHSRIASRRASTNPMPPPPAPAVLGGGSPAVNILPSNQTAVNSGQTPSPLPSPSLHPALLATTPPTSAESMAGAGPLRHPRAMTAVELHQQFEREQESVVNRLARELSLLRSAQNASVVSATSSTSAGPHSDHPTPDTHLLSGPNFPYPTPRHRRTSSSTSMLSQAAAAAPHLSSSAEARRAPQLSRQNSLSRRSRTGSPAPLPPDGSSHYFYQQQQRGAPPHPATAGGGPSSVVAALGSAAAAYAAEQDRSPGLIPATARYEEAVFYKSELDGAKRENEALKRRVRELERMLRERRGPVGGGGDAGRPRSESVSTTASVGVSGAGGGVAIAGPRDGRPAERDRGVSVTGSVGVGVPEEEVKVGESAASAGLR